MSLAGLPRFERFFDRIAPALFVGLGLIAAFATASLAA